MTSEGIKAAHVNNWCQTNSNDGSPILAVSAQYHQQWRTSISDVDDITAGSARPRCGAVIRTRVVRWQPISVVSALVCSLRTRLATGVHARRQRPGRLRLHAIEAAADPSRVNRIIRRDSTRVCSSERCGSASLGDRRFAESSGQPTIGVAEWRLGSTQAEDVDGGPTAAAHSARWINCTAGQKWRSLNTTVSK